MPLNEFSCVVYIGPADHVTLTFNWQARLVAKERYKQKLESVGLLLSDDPYVESNSHRFSDDMSLWPRMEYGPISLNDLARIPRSSCFHGSSSSL